ncbi:MAG: hypothetical protein IJL75_06505, partial [Eubacterium sp.]|nr:hypothetical protein [Eubacterium sp.]
MKKNVARVLSLLMTFLMLVNGIFIHEAIAKEKKIPVAAGANKYSTKIWNKTDLRKATNCYAYAFNLRSEP